MIRFNKLYIFFHEMNPDLVFYHHNIVQQSDAVNWPNQLETKKSKRFCTRAGSGIGLIENERMCWFVRFSLRKY